MNKTSMITTPSTNFETVEALLKNAQLNDEEKIAALLNWMATCELEQESTLEGMPGPSCDNLDEIIQALKKLEK